MNNVLIIGSGGREHAIASKLANSPHVKHVFVIPGNDGMISSKISIVNIDTKDFKKLIEFSKSKNIYFSIVGPEVELSLGIVDAFEKEKLKIFGPNKYASQLESSKSFCKERMEEYSIPTAKYKIFNNAKQAIEYTKNLSFPIVIKVNGLAAGKGVSIPHTFEESKIIIEQYINESKFGDAGNEIIIEEFLEGDEFSQLALVNDDQIIYMNIARDYKRAYDNDEGENTGGMGAYTPVNLSKKEIFQSHEIIKKMVLGMKNSGHPFKGVLYAGLITTKKGVKVIEFNVRFGDPETQVILSALKSDLFIVIKNILNKKNTKLQWSDNYFVGVVLAAKGYPNKYAKNIELPLFNNNEKIFYMGVKLLNNKLVSNGGRVLISIGQDRDINTARNIAYATLDNKNLKHFFYRKDIALTK